MPLIRKEKRKLSGWGNYPVSEAFVSRPERQDFPISDGSHLIARGLGCSYGDAALNADHQVILMERLDRFLSFAEKSGLLRAEAGGTFFRL